MTQLNFFRYKDYTTIVMYQKMNDQERDVLLSNFRWAYDQEKDLWGTEIVKKNVAKRLNISYRLSSQLKVYIERLEPMLQDKKIARRFGLNSYKKLPTPEQERLSALVKERVLDLVSGGMNLQDAEKKVCEERGLTFGLIEELSIPAGNISKINNRNFGLKF